MSRIVLAGIAVALLGVGLLLTLWGQELKDAAKYQEHYWGRGVDRRFYGQALMLLGAVIGTLAFYSAVVGQSPRRWRARFVPARALGGLARWRPKRLPQSRHQVPP
jgi:hypothetical protein